MQRRSLSGLGIALVAAVALSVAHAEEPQGKPSCPVSGRPAKTEHSVPYKGGEVYFCCPNCPGAFKEDTAKFADKANHQLVQTGQAEQTACPLTGKPVDSSKSANIHGVDVNFCCGNCEKKVKTAEPAEQMKLVFADKPFEKGFKVESKK